MRNTPSSHAGCLTILIAPSGAGKTSLVRALLREEPQTRLSVSHTTRAPRAGEADGEDYFFVTEETFESLKASGIFLEWAVVHGNYYGTSRNWIEHQMAQGIEVLLEIDWQGAIQVQRSYPNAVTVFIIPPSLDALHQRLVSRGKDSPKAIQCRLEAAREELAQAHRFEFTIVNADFDCALHDLRTILAASRLRYFNQLAQYPDLLGPQLSG